MQTADFTPGPWYAVQADRDYPVRIRDEAGDLVLATGDDGGHVDPQFALPDETILANAHMMAAAPELYSALLELRDWVRHAGTPTARAMQRANFALAKARGEMVLA